MRVPVSDDRLTLEAESEGPGIPNRLCKYLREVSKHQCMTREEERETALRARTEGGNEAYQKIVLTHLGLVVSIALQYHSHFNLFDLIQEGNVGLLQAVRKYDPERGTRFSTYATFWIRAHILKYLRNSWSVVKIGTTDNQRRLFYCLKREREKMMEFGTVPSAQALANRLRTSTKEVEEMERRLYYQDVSLEEPEWQDALPPRDVIASGEDVEEEVIEKDSKDKLQRQLHVFRMRLNQKERFIFDSRMIAEDPLTLAEIGDHFGTSKEAVRQMEARVRGKLSGTFKSNRCMLS